jgi:hypothetical protein
VIITLLPSAAISTSCDSVLWLILSATAVSRISRRYFVVTCTTKGYKGIDLSKQIIESDIRQSNELEYYYHII